MKNKELIEVVRLLGGELPKAEKVHSTKLSNLIYSKKNKIFSCVFIKKDGSVRNMNCRVGVKKGIKGTGKSRSNNYNSYLTVFDMNKGNYRMINLTTMLIINIGGKQYYVEQ